MGPGKGKRVRLLVTFERDNFVRKKRKVDTEENESIKKADLKKHLRLK